MPSKQKNWTDPIYIPKTKEIANATNMPPTKKKPNLFNPSPHENHKAQALATAQLLKELGSKIHPMENINPETLQFKSTDKKGITTTWFFHSSQPPKICHHNGKTENFQIRGIGGLLDRLRGQTT